MRRPTSLTFICWLHIGFYLLISLATIFSPDIRHSVVQQFVWFEVLLSVVFMLAMVVACLLMLSGKAIGRIIYVVTSLASFIDLLFNAEDPLSTLPSLLIRLLIFYFLFRQPANQYFASFSAQKNSTIPSK